MAGEPSSTMFTEYKGTALILDPTSSSWRTWTQSWTWPDNLHSHHAIKWPRTAAIQKLYQITAALSKTTGVIYLKTPTGERKQVNGALLSHYHGEYCPLFFSPSSAQLTFLFSFSSTSCCSDIMTPQCHVHETQIWSDKAIICENPQGRTELQFSNANTRGRCYYRCLLRGLILSPSLSPTRARTRTSIMSAVFESITVPVSVSPFVGFLLYSQCYPLISSLSLSLCVCVRVCVFTCACVL